MIRASIDIGSNSTILLIGKISLGTFEEIETISRVTGLGREVSKTESFSDLAMEETLSAFEEFKDAFVKHGVKSEDVFATATEASRVAKNASEFFSKIKSKYGVSVKIISSEGEAFYAAKGLTLGLSKTDDQEITIMDIGGSSTELIRVRAKPSFEILYSVSYPVGVVKVSEWLQEDDFQIKFDNFFSSLSLDEFKAKNIWAIAGTMTLFSAISQELVTFEISSINNHSLDKNKFDECLNKIVQFSTEEIQTKYPYSGKRSKTIKAGGLIANTIINRLETSNISFSNFGLRHGTLLMGEVSRDFIVGE